MFLSLFLNTLYIHAKYGKSKGFHKVCQQITCMHPISMFWATALLQQKTNELRPSASNNTPAQGSQRWTLNAVVRWISQIH